MAIMITCLMIFAIALQAVMILYSLYSAVLVPLAIKKHRPIPKSTPRHRFAILVPARNEASVIGPLLDSLDRQHYPRDLYDVFVVPNNCTDNTGAIARQAGAQILTGSQPIRTKGDVLNFAFVELSRQTHEYDAVCVIDADNLVHPGYLSAMNDALTAGARVAQGYKDIKNPHDSAVTGSNAILIWLLIRFFNHARSTIGLSAAISGSGFMIRTDVLRKLDMSRTFTITEDLELSIKCYLEDEHIVWVPDAIIYDEQALSFGTSWNQRKRWSSGMYQVLSLYFPRVLHKAVRDKSLQGFDIVSLLLPAVMHVVSSLFIISSTALSILLVLDGQITGSAFFAVLSLSTLATYVFVTAVACLTAFLERKLTRHLIPGILFFWVFLMSWLPINIICLIRPTTTWSEIRHSRSIRLQDLSADP
jgi:cellulose synthase/poly-beta-1,6-N-acetylglucosamine synthase-like glycosyltransferase